MFFRARGRPRAGDRFARELMTRGTTAQVQHGGHSPHTPSQEHQYLRFNRSESHCKGREELRNDLETAPLVFLVVMGRLDEVKEPQNIRPGES